MQMVFRPQDKAEYGLSFLLILGKDRGLYHSNALFSEYSDGHLLEHGDVGDDECAFNVADDFSSQSDFFSYFLDLRPGLKKEFSDHHRI
jgi:hypothetical protein